MPSMNLQKVIFFLIVDHFFYVGNGVLTFKNDVFDTYITSNPYLIQYYMVEILGYRLGPFMQ